MSGTDDIRDVADHWHDMGEPVKLKRSTVYTLCDLADAFRDYENAPSYTANCDCADCAMYRSRVMNALKCAREALARLDDDVGG